jgi:hypothetical protein
MVRYLHCVDEPLIIAKALAIKLIERRLPTIENELSKVFRELSPEEKLEIVIQLMEKTYERRQLLL